MEQQQNYRISLATPNDVDRFYPLFEKSMKTQFSEYTDKTIQYYLQKEYPPDVMKDKILKKSISLLLAYKEEAIVGYLIGQRVYGGIAFGEWLGVDDAHQRQGIGSALLQAWEQHSIQLGAHKIHLWTAEKNVGYYQKRGYVLVGKVPDNYFGTDDYFMYKTLRKSHEDNFLKD